MITCPPRSAHTSFVTPKPPRRDDTSPTRGGSSVRWPGLAGLCALCVLASALVATPAQAASKKEEAAALSVVAGAKAKSGQHKICAEMYVQCYRLDPSFLGYLYSAARCAQKAGNLDDAEKHYREFDLRAPTEHPLRKRTALHLKEIMVARSKQVAAAEKAKAEQAKAAKAAAAKAAADAKRRAAAQGSGGQGNAGAGNSGAGNSGAGQGVAKPAPAKPMSGQTLAGLSLSGGGVVLLGVAGWLAAGASSDASALNDDLSAKRGGLITGVAHQDAVDRQASIHGKRNLALAAGGLGAAALATGLWLWLSDTDEPAKSTLWLTPAGQVGWRVQW